MLGYCAIAQMPIAAAPPIVEVVSVVARAGVGAGLYVDPAILRKRVKIKRRRDPHTYVIKIGDWPDELVTPPKKKRFVEDDSRYVRSAIDWATSDAEPEDEEEMRIIRELLDEL